MWKCPRCGRAFQKREQSHYCGRAPETVDAYIALQPEEARPCLHAVRRAIREALPDAQERISWSMPSYWNRHNIIQFAAFQRHIGLYPGPEAVERFAEDLKGFKTRKGTIQLPYSRPIPLDLIARIAKWCDETGNHP